jgi:hypothetical protein
MQTDRNIDVTNLCSRKLWEILTIEQQQNLSYQQKHQIEQELIARQHYLQELAKLRQQLH